MIKTEINGIEHDLNKEQLCNMLKSEKFGYMEFSTDIEFCGQYITSVFVKIQKGDNYCNPKNKDKIFTYIDHEDTGVGVRLAKKVINRSIIKRKVTIGLYDQ